MCTEKYDFRGDSPYMHLTNYAMNYPVNVKNNSSMKKNFDWDQLNGPEKGESTKWSL